MTTNNNRFNMDWWVVQKRLIYIIVGALILSMLLAITSINEVAV